MWIIVSLIVLSFLIFFHELGHFTIARIFGVKVEVFSIGFGKKILTKNHNGTQYAISAIPLGGYVKMKGQDDLNPNEYNTDDDSFNAKAPWKKICILFAGSGANIVFAFLLYVFIGLYGTNAILPSIGGVVNGSPAQQAGLMDGDIIVRLDNKHIRIWRDISDYVSESSAPIAIEFMRNGEIRHISITPEIKDGKNIFGESIKKGFLGIRAKGEVEVVRYGIDEILPFAWNETLYASKLILLGVQKLITGIVPKSELGGPIAIVQVISQAQESGLVALLGITALISINLGILNLFPIPALDGGHILFTIYEWCVRKPLSEGVMYKLTVCGWILLFCLMALGVYNDISRIATTM